MKNRTLLTALTALAFFEPPFWGVGGFAQSINIEAAIPAYIDVSGLAPDEVRYMEHEFAVDVPLSSGTVQVWLGMAAGDSSIAVRDFPLGTNAWPDSTWVAPAAGGHRLGLGRYTGLDAVHVRVLSGGTVIGTGLWERP